ncbi:MAG: HlyD family type I secretion periplasmic adaptor subunit [Syntrophorhabdaceae bacterium]|nr:HlyD family type I secretion periplasmic adaptor subunit [Syntrophorhabdaceae bacterium]
MKIMDRLKGLKWQGIVDRMKGIFHAVSCWPQFVFRNDDAHEFKPTMAEIEERPASPLGRVVFWTIVATMVFFVAWMCLGKVDVVVSARGMIIPEGDVKILQPLDTGVVSAIMCREGDFVKKDQVLVEIDPSITVPELESKQKNLKYLELEKMRLNATMGKGSFKPNDRDYDAEALRTQRELYRSSAASLEKQLAAKREELRSVQEDRSHNVSLLAMARDREERMKAVADIISKNEYEKAVNDVLTYGNNVQQLTHKIGQLTHEIAYINENFQATNLKEFSDRHKTVTEIQAEIDKTTFRNQKQKILSPVDGYVSNLYFHTIGGVVTPAQKLMIIVPMSAPLTIKVSVLNKDIGFIRDGMGVSVKIDTFDFQKYGILNGTVRSISKHSTEDEKLGAVYEVFVTPGETTFLVEGKRVPITSGMSLTAEIKVGKRRVIEFFIYPIIKYLDEGIKVR